MDKSLSNLLRWVFFIPLSFICAGIAFWLFYLFFVGLPELLGYEKRRIEKLFQPSIISYSAILAGSLIAPSKNVGALILFIISVLTIMVGLILGLIGYENGSMEVHLDYYGLPQVLGIVVCFFTYKRMLSSTREELLD